MNLILECGIIGLAGFCFFSAAIFRTFYRMAAMRRGGSRIWGALLFSFWCGECVQMMALDAYNYWRTITV
ncbi:MAG: hypothetical protein DMG21_05025, partial [Acidobacteria bacterium]